ncbi:uncharacterized protein EI90DRAFT_3062877 [Cantharellus anzutake]|uniref:uncharacterized protein n=1 Tax=Cantharellus anzutake TaxID=1750568 RepID=UPI001904B306|nr:uncharacterized protein EI90DRAFT_3062877 [Cantharellus anzutake]KAF8329519.1 hypothetical protein EI90DRAFT_3062877 [Cantharellus anzutake]
MATLPRTQNLGKNPWSSAGPEFEHLNEAWERARDYQDECATEEDLVCARLLGYLLQEASHGRGGTQLAKEINRCDDIESLRGLALFYRKHLIICC